ncbi:hypothetical protein [Hymenobacter antarcticus]|uniref:Outer membrane lipoprotein carrier protein LolA n=1 Tax=Hymenobacter antarcticus TaxID=486270 RepID=A0ABP7PH37_9BACT
MIRISIVLVILALLELASAPVATAQRFFDTKGMGLMKGQQPGTSKLNYGDNRAVAVKVLGKPTKTAKMYFEIEHDTAVVYYYRTNKLYFLKGHLIDFELNDNTLAFGKTPDQALRIGSRLIVVAGQAKTASAKRYLLNNQPLVDLIVDTKPGKSRNVNYSTVAYNSIRYGTINSDASIEILFDANNKVILIATSN